MRRGLAMLASATLLSACAPATRDGGGALAREGDWLCEQRRLGAGTVVPAHVVAHGAGIRLIADGASREGASIRSRELFGAGDFRASLRCTAPRGTVCALFLYEPDAGDAADEIDIELIGGTRAVWLTTWVAGVRTNHVALELPFDPADDFHVYEIRRRRDLVAFLVDGEALAVFERDVPARPMALFANAWWPAWLEAEPSRGALEIAWMERPASAANSVAAHGS